MFEVKEIRDCLYDQFARVGRAISHAKRLHILHLLCQGDKTVERLAQETDQTIASTSAHLQILKHAHLVVSRKDGRYVYYATADDAVLRFWLNLQEVGRRQSPEVRELVQLYFSDVENMSDVEVDELLSRVARSEVILLDMRPIDEYEARHIPGAQSLPYDELEQRVGELPKDKEIWIYCRGSFCVTALETVSYLRELGFNAHRLSGGIAEWRAR
jgi:ArsR family transcriptional regulator